jgi:hypothetical protein
MGKQPLAKLYLERDKSAELSYACLPACLPACQIIAQVFIIMTIPFLLRCERHKRG